MLPIGVFEHHPYTGERLIPEEFCKPPVKKTRYGRTLELLGALAPKRAVLSHVEEMDRVSTTANWCSSAQPTAGSPPGTAC